MERCHLAIITNNEKGINLALKLEEKGYSVALYDVDSIIEGKFSSLEKQEGKKKGISRVYDIDSLVLFLAEPKKLFLVGDASIFSSQMLSILYNKLPIASTLVDFCDCHYEEVAKNVRHFNEKGIRYLSLGFIEGLDGDFCIFPGGSYQGYKGVEDMLKAISDDNSYYLGSDGAGQFCKMVHDALNSSLLQLLAEHIEFLKQVLACDNDEIYNILSDFNSRETLNSHMLDILIDVYRRVDYDSDLHLVDLVSDVIYFDLSSYWLGQATMLLGISCPTLLAAVNLKFSSYLKGERKELSKSFQTKKETAKENEKKSFISLVESSLYMCIATTYAQAHSLLFKASELYAYEIPFPSLMDLLNNSSLIRSRLLRRIGYIVKRQELSNLFLDQDFIRITKDHMKSLRTIVSNAANYGVSMPGSFASLSYIDTISKERLPTGINQLYKDYVEGVGYEKRDESGFYYADWQDPNKVIKSKKQKN